MKQIHELIKSERVKANLSEEEMATRLKINRSTYQYWEKSTPSIDKIKRIAKALGKNENYFFITDDEKSVNQQQKEEVTDVIPGEASVTVQQYLDELRFDKKELQEIVRVNLTAIAKMLASLSKHDQAYHETMLRSLARLENRNESDLVLEAGTKEVNQME